MVPTLLWATKYINLTYPLNQYLCTMDNTTSKAELLTAIKILDEAYENDYPFLVLASDNANKLGAFLIQGRTSQLIELLNYAHANIPEFKEVFNTWLTTSQHPKT